MCYSVLYITKVIYARKVYYLKQFLVSAKMYSNLYQIMYVVAFSFVVFYFC
jgi:hypothetical protein